MSSEIINLKIASIKKIIQSKDKLEKKLNLKLETKNNNLILTGEEVDLFIARRIIEAIDRGFEISIALLLLDEEYTLEVIPIKAETRKANLERVRGRVIGTKGKTLEIIGDLSECHLVLHDNLVNIIGPFEKIKIAENAIKSLIRGSKQANIYSYLEQSRSNKNRSFQYNKNLNTSKDQKE